MVGAYTPLQPWHYHRALGDSEHQLANLVVVAGLRCRWLWRCGCVCVPLDPPVTTAQGCAGARPGLMVQRLPLRPASYKSINGPIADRVSQTAAKPVSTRAMWLVALIFAMYSSQWLAVIGFLPTTVQARAGLAAVSAVAHCQRCSSQHLGQCAGRSLIAARVPPSVCYWLGLGPWAWRAVSVWRLVQGNPAAAGSVVCRVAGLSALAA